MARLRNPHGAVTQSPWRVGLRLKKSIEKVARQPLGLFRANGLAAADTSKGEIDLFVVGRIGQFEKTVHLSDGIKPTADRRRYS